MYYIHNLYIVLLLFTYSNNRRSTSFFNNPLVKKQYNYLKDTEDVQQDHTITCGQQWFIYKEFTVNPYIAEKWTR